VATSGECIQTNRSADTGVGAAISAGNHLKRHLCSFSYSCHKNTQSLNSVGFIVYL